VDVLINNAAAGAIRAGYENVRDEQWRETWELVFLSVIRMTTAALPALLEGGEAKAIVSRAEAAMPHRRFVRPEEVADLIAYLASARAGSISGVDILIDAGLTQTL
jgi:NAD(P)-dependent dehydrogenase (short-subunit alcohol dehydrogenase family)